MIRLAIGGAVGYFVLRDAASPTWLPGGKLLDTTLDLPGVGKTRGMAVAGAALGSLLAWKLL